MLLLRTVRLCLMWCRRSEWWEVGAAEMRRASAAWRSSWDTAVPAPLSWWHGQTLGTQPGRLSTANCSLLKLLLLPHNLLCSVRKNCLFLPSLPYSVGEGVMFLDCPIVPFVRSSGQIYYHWMSWTEGTIWYNWQGIITSPYWWSHYILEVRGQRSRSQQAAEIKFCEHHDSSSSSSWSLFETKMSIEK